MITIYAEKEFQYLEMIKKKFLYRLIFKTVKLTFENFPSKVFISIGFPLVDVMPFKIIVEETNLIKSYGIPTNLSRFYSDRSNFIDEILE